MRIPPSQFAMLRQSCAATCTVSQQLSLGQEWTQTCVCPLGCHTPCMASPPVLLLLLPLFLTVFAVVAADSWSHFVHHASRLASMCLPGGNICTLQATPVKVRRVGTHVGSCARHSPCHCGGTCTCSTCRGLEGRIHATLLVLQHCAGDGLAAVVVQPNAVLSCFVCWDVVASHAALCIALATATEMHQAGTCWGASILSTQGSNSNTEMMHERHDRRACMMCIVWHVDLV